MKPWMKWAFTLVLLVLIALSFSMILSVIYANWGLPRLLVAMLFSWKELGNFAISSLSAFALIQVAALYFWLRSQWNVGASLHVLGLTLPTYLAFREFYYLHMVATFYVPFTREGQEGFFLTTIGLPIAMFWLIGAFVWMRARSATGKKPA